MHLGIGLVSAFVETSSIGQFPPALLVHLTTVALSNMLRY